MIALFNRLLRASINGRTHFCCVKLNEIFPNLQVRITAADQSTDSIHRSVPASILTALTGYCVEVVPIAGIHIESLASEYNYVNQSISFLLFLDYLNVEFDNSRYTAAERQKPSSSTMHVTVASSKFPQSANRPQL